MSSSIHIEKVNTGSFLHNDRTMKVSYLIDTSDKNECSTSSTVAIKKFNELKAEAIKNYTERTHQKIQKSTIFLKEAIVNLQEHHTLKDLKQIKKKLESYGFTVLQMSIHRDEGFVNKDNKKEKNYHAHITMFNLDVETGRTVKFGKNYRSELSKLQTFVAETLNMKRGKVSVKQEAKKLNVKVSKATRRLDTHDYKRAMKIKEKELELQQQYNFREYQKKITALEELTSEQKKELHRLNSAARKDVAKILELTQALEEQKQLNNTLKTQKNDLAKKYNNIIKQIKNVNEVYTEVARALDVETNTYEQARDDIISKFKSTKQEVRELTQTLESKNATIYTLEQEKTAYKQDMSDMQKQLINARETIETQKTTISTLEQEKSVLEQDMSVLKSKYEEIKEAFTDVAQKLSIKFDTVKQVATDIISKFKSTNQTETVTETDTAKETDTATKVDAETDEIFKQMIENAKKAEQKQSLKLK